MFIIEEFDDLVEKIQNVSTQEEAKRIFQMIPGEYPTLLEFARSKWLSLSLQEAEKITSLEEGKRVYGLTPAGTLAKELIGQRCLMLALVL